MPARLTPDSAPSVVANFDPAVLDLLLAEHREQRLPRMQRLWEYYRNDLVECRGGATVGRWYRVAQEQGLPARIVGPDGAKAHPHDPTGTQRREVVVENDIAWRVHALVDFMFGKPVALQSAAPDPQRATLLETFLREVFDAAGGPAFFQDLALLGCVYGYVDVMLRLGDPRNTNASGEPAGFVLELIEAPRGIPVLAPSDYRRLDAYALHYRQVLNQVEPVGFMGRIRRRLGGDVQRASIDCTEVWTADSVSHYRGAGDNFRGRRLISDALNPLGRVPIIHIQNLPQPFFYEGLSEVEPLIPLQDELNTRLSDRANRVTFQSFKMYLGRGIEDFVDRPIGPGQMWQTSSENASIQEFGGDASSPSEEAHITEIREAMDKTSAVTAVAAGLLRNKVGNLTSENALRITMMGLLAKTEKKRIAYGAGLAKLCELILHAADVTGALPNSPDERKVRFDWPSPLPEDTSQRLRDAKLKLEIGVPRKQVLTELGYAEHVDAEAP
jgi:hypothetical protein